MKRQKLPAQPYTQLQERFGRLVGVALRALEGAWCIDQPLCRYTSLRVGGVADALFAPATLSALQELMRLALREGIPLFYLGKGTNLLIKDKGIRGIVVMLGREFQIIHILEENPQDPTQVVLGVGGGVRLSRLVHFAKEAGLTGLEFAVGIPGSVGGAVKMNAGTGRGSFGELLLSATVLERGGEVHTLSRKELAFSYRTSHLPLGSVVVAAQLALKRGEKHLIAQEVAVLDKKRRETQPLALPSAGCIFRNPLPLQAGKIIDDLGLKGLRIGDAQVSEKHANFIVNLGHTTAEEVLLVIERVKEAVYRQERILLEEEVQIVGE